MTRRAFAVLALTAVGCGGGASEHRVLPAGDAFAELPAGATVVDRGELLALLDRVGHLLTPDQVEAWHAAEEARRAEAMERATALYAGQEGLLERLTATPDAADPRVTALDDGSYLVDLVGAGDPADAVVTHGPHVVLADLVASRERFEDPENQRGLYALWYVHLSADARRGLPDPDALDGHTFPDLVQLNDDVASVLVRVGSPCRAPPAGRPADATGEWRRGLGLDVNGTTQPTGLAVQACYTLKWYWTSVKRQGIRGTSTSFAVTAAAETMVAYQHGLWASLSEQMLYNRAKQKWWPSTYGDGLDPGSLLTAMSGASGGQATSFAWPYEDDWNYNASAHRTDTGHGYIRSCWGYPRPQCSDTNHQAQLFCAGNATHGWHCVLMDPVFYYGSELAAPQGHWAAVQPYALPQPASAGGVPWARACLQAGVPVVLTSLVPPGLDWDAVSSDGFVTSFGGMASRGAHSMLVVGWVANEDLPAGAPAGDGGGYFICKNSWGVHYGDAGFVYLPASWVQTWGISLHIFQVAQAAYSFAFG
jgi:hypothetical protein